VRGLGRVKYMANRAFGRAAILAYHRVADVPLDPQQLCVTPERFEEHLRVLVRDYRPVSLQRLADQLEAGRSAPRRSVVLTIDDGYADNLLNARPLLQRYGIPATVFVTSDHVGTGKEIYTSTLIRVMLLSESLPEELVLSVDGENHRWRVPPDADGRMKVHDELRTLLASTDSREREGLAGRLLDWAQMPREPRPDYRMLTVDELRELAADGLVEIGAHTQTHPRLSSLGWSDQIREITGSREVLEAMLGRPVTAFAYPYGCRGDYNADSVAAAREAGFRVACSVFTGLVTRWTDRWQLPRYTVRNWDGGRFEQFARWMFSLCPRLTYGGFYENPDG